MAVALSVSIALAGCGDTPTSSTYSPLASPRAATHVVVEGDTLYRIANEFGVSVGRLMAANQISDPRELRVGQVLTIPGAGYRASSIGTASTGVLPYSGERASRQFQWPVAQGVVSSGFGIRNGAMHDGVSGRMRRSQRSVGRRRRGVAASGERDRNRQRDCHARARNPARSCTYLDHFTRRPSPPRTTSLRVREISVR